MPAALGAMALGRGGQDECGAKILMNGCRSYPWNDENDLFLPLREGHQGPSLERISS